MAKATKWDYSKIKNFPEGGTIQRSGTGLIVIRRKTVYDPRIGRGRDASREYLARILNETFRKPRSIVQTIKPPKSAEEFGGFR